MILSFVMMIAFSLNTHAAANQENQMIAISNNPYVIIEDNGNEMIFASIEDFEIYQDANSNKQARYGEMWLLQETIATENKNHYFVGYHSGTPNWTPASQYTIANGKGFNIAGTYTFRGVPLNIGFSYSVSVATAIPANANRYSRLGVYADYVFKSERYAEYSYGVPTGNTRVSTYCTRTNNYIKPVYQ